MRHRLKAISTGCAVLIMLTSACSNNDQPAALSSPPVMTAAPSVPGTMAFELDSANYTLPVSNEQTKRYNYAVKTPEGIVWAPAPPMEGKDRFTPLQPYVLYLSDATSPILDVQQAQKLITLPLQEDGWKVMLNGLYSAGDYVVYHTALVQQGVVQAKKDQAWVLKVSDPANSKEILTYHTAGGYFYDYGLDKDKEIYVSVSTVPSGDDYEKEVYAYVFETGRQEKIQDYSISDGSIHFMLNSHPYEVKLQPA